MKNLYSNNEFANLHVNENIFKTMFQGIMKYANKIKGSKEIKGVFDKYKITVDDVFGKMQNIEQVNTVSNKTTNTNTKTPANYTNNTNNTNNTNTNPPTDTTKNVNKTKPTKKSTITK